MVRNEALSLYLFLGHDIIAPDGSSRKDALLERIKSTFLKPESEKFNLDITYGKEMTLPTLQKLFLELPVNAPKRMLVIKEAQHLKNEAKEFLLSRLGNRQKTHVIVLDISSPGYRDSFIQMLTPAAKVFHFREEPKTNNSFVLARQIQFRRVKTALQILHQLLETGEKPERIIGGLRYAWAKEIVTPLVKRRKLKLLLNCDLEIKTGRLKGNLALEQLVVKLCAL